MPERWKMTLGGKTILRAAATALAGAALLLPAAPAQAGFFDQLFGNHGNGAALQT